MATISRLAFILVVYTFCCVGIEANPRRRRQSSTISIITNTSIPCEPITPQAVQMAKIELTNEEKEQLFLTKGGKIMDKYMARTPGEANINFPSLLPVADSITKYIIDHIESSQLGDSRLTKNIIKAYMKRSLYSETPVKENARKPIREILPWMSRSRAAGRTQRETYSDILKSMKYIRDIKRRILIWKGWLTDQGQEESIDFPLLLPEMLGMEEEYNEQHGVTRQVDFCINRGTATADGNHLRSCSVCSSTKVMTEDSWPRYLNEASCSPTDLGCIFVNDQAQGACQQVTAPINMLRRSSTQCILALKDGETVMADEWNIVTELINVGCECNIHKNSYLADFV